VHTQSHRPALWTIGLTALLVALGFSTRRSEVPSSPKGERRRPEDGRGRSARKPSEIPPLMLTAPLLNDVKRQMLEAACEMSPEGVSRTLTINHGAPPFDNRELRRAMTLTLDRKAFIGIISAGQGDVGGVMQPLPEGIWGMPPEILRTLPGYDPDVEKSRTEARQIMGRLGYGLSNRLKVKVMTRDIPDFRDPTVLLIDQLKEAYIDGELEPVDTTNFFPRILRKDYLSARDAPRPKHALHP
jgi:peptide/nickel transport system substrate-binding protein